MPDENQSNCYQLDVRGYSARGSFSVYSYASQSFDGLDLYTVRSFSPHTYSNIRESLTRLTPDRVG